MRALISIIIPTYNSGNTLTECLNSIVNQTNKDFEIIIVDGVSNDATPEIVKQYQTKYNNIIFVSEKDKGIYDAMNKGIQIANGKWLLFFGSDDVLYNEAVFSKINKVLNNKDFQVVYGNVLRKHSNIIYNGKYNKYKILVKNICHQSLFYRKELFQLLGNYNLEYKALADWDFNLRWFLNQSIKRKYVGEIIATYNENGDGSSLYDTRFNADFDKNIKNYNSPMFYFLYKNRRNKLFGKINRFILSNI